jgi:RNA polymerase sigma-70 factor, ECF subfamily
VSAASDVKESAKRPTLEEVYALHARFVFRVLRGMGVADAQADDALQDVFLVVHQRLDAFDSRAQITSWLFQIALRVACNYRRKAKRAKDHTPVGDELAGAAQTPLEYAEETEAVRQLQVVLGKLGDDARAVLILADIEERTAPEIASLTGTPLNTVYTRLRRARSALLELWRERGGAR